MKKGVDYIGIGTGALVLNAEGKVLLGLRGPKATNEVGKWEFPGGGVEFGETCEAAVVREIAEEFGIEIEVKEWLDVVDHILPEEKQHWVSVTFIARHVAGTPRIFEPEKIERFVWKAFSEIEEATLSMVSRHNLRSFRDRYGNQPPTYA